MTRDRMQEALDDAVERGRMTRDDATDLLGELFRRGRKQTDDLISDLEALLAGTRRPADRVLREVRRATGLGPPFPISGYDDLTAAQVTERLGGLSPAELRAVLANLFDTDWESAEFYYESQYPAFGETAPVADFHFTPGIPRSLYVTATYSF